MTPNLFSTIGHLLHGERWKQPLADDLGVNERTIRRWAAGSPMRDGIEAELATLLRKRMTLMRNMLERIA